MHNANEAVKLGLVSPAVLLIGMKLREVGEGLGVNLDQMSRAKKFRPLWRAISRRLDEIYAEERKRQRKVDRKPNEYVCAAEGCGIRGKNAEDPAEDEHRGRVAREQGVLFEFRLKSTGPRRTHRWT